MTEHIRDYLQTQNLKLDADAVRVAELAAQAVMAQGQALIEHDVLWYEQPEVRLAEHIEANEQHSGLLKQLFMALDSAYARHPVQSAVLYGLLPDDSALVRLVQQGQPIEQRLATDDTTAAQYLAAHSSRTGWLNLADDVSHWLEIGELSGEHNRRSAAQMSLPVYGADGRVFGVLHIEQAEGTFAAEAQTEWLGLALACLAPLQTLLPRPQADEEDQAL